VRASGRPGAARSSFAAAGDGAPALLPLSAARRALVGELMAAHLTGGGLILAAVHDPLPISARAVEIGA
jgi:hypothetical protein